MRVLTQSIGLDELAGGVLVPTMGALHHGHASLIRLAQEASRSAQSRRPIVVTIFVNPTQFGPGEDFTRYPRTLEADLDLCRSLGVDAVFAPAPEVMYPPGAEVPVGALPPVATEPGLEDAHRPGHFAGVVQVVRRLFVLTRPRASVFGEKDWQQLQVIRAMTRDERLGVEIIPGPTVREPDGLALSSRNRYLDPQERDRARSLSEALRVACEAADPAGAERLMRRVLDRAGVVIDYAAVRVADSLLPPESGGTGPMRALVAGRLGKTRLLDNAPWSPATV